MNALLMGVAGLLEGVCKTHPAGSIPDASTMLCPSAGMEDSRDLHSRAVRHPGPIPGWGITNKEPRR